MAGQGEGSSSSGNVSDSSVQLNIKTLDSSVYCFQGDKNMPVLSLKEKIANEIGIPVAQQRLIFRGKVLKDEHVLSEYHVENGDTLHLVERQPNQSQGSGTSSAEPAGNNGNQGNDVGSAPPRTRVGSISHSVVLGTFNMGDQGEGVVPDLTRVIGAVLNSIGIGGQSPNSIPNANQTSAAPPSGNEAGGMHAGNQNVAGNQAQSGQTFPGQAFQSLPQVVQIPVAAGAIPIPSLNAPIPDSLNTLAEFINRMEQTLSQNGYRPNFSSTNPGEQVELPSNAQGLPTVEALSTVLHRAEQLLSHQAVSALSHIAGRLEREGTSSDLSTRGQIQSESVQIGIAMQHLGAFLLELGRTMLTLRMGQSSAESVVNAGPAVYISPSGPNPIMVQPFPLQTNSLFGGPVASSTPPTLGAIGVGSAPRNVNIHIHAGTSLAPIVSAINSRANNGEGTRSERRNDPGSDDSGSAQTLPVRNVLGTGLPSDLPGVGVASSTQSDLGVSTSQPSESDPAPTVAEINSLVRNILRNMQGDNSVQSDQMEASGWDLSAGSESRPAQGNEQLDTRLMNASEAASASSVGCASVSGVQKPQTEAVRTCSNDESLKLEDAPSVSERQGVTEPTKAAPLGLGVSGLERKRRTQPQQPVSKGAGSSSDNQSQQTRTHGQNILQNLASHGSAVNLRNANGPPQQPLPSTNNQIDMAGLMSQVLHSPALNGLLEGVSQQTGVESPDGLRNMLQQFTQSPQMMNTVNQIVQQVGSQDMGNMFSGMESRQGAGLDLSSMFQQMMPIVSQVLVGGNPPSLFSTAEPESQAPYRDGTFNRDLNLQPVADRIENLSPPTDVFRAVAENAFHVSGSGSASSDLLDELCSNESLAGEYMEMLRHDVSQRLQGHSEPDKP